VKEETGKKGYTTLTSEWEKKKGRGKQDARTKQLRKGKNKKEEDKELW